MLHRLTLGEQGRIKPIVLPDLYRSVAPVRRNQQAQLSALLRLGEVLLVISRLQPLLLGKHPDLIHVHRLGFRRIEFAVCHARARAHVLDVAGLDRRAVAHAVAVLQGALEHVGNDFHVAVRMHRKAAATRDAVIVHHPQGAKVHVLWVMVIGERKTEMGVQPTVVGVAALVALANLDHGGLRAATPIILVITTIVKRHNLSPRPWFWLLVTPSIGKLCPAVLPAGFRPAPFGCKVVKKTRQSLRCLRGLWNELSTFRYADPKTGRSHHRPRNAHHYRQPHRKILRNSRQERHHPRRRPSPDQSRCQRIRVDELRPGLQQYRFVYQQNHVYRWRRRHPALPRLSHRRSRRKEYLSRDGLFTAARRTADARAIERLDLPHHASHLHP